MENKDLIATALRMIGKNIILIADCICKEDEPEAVTEEKPKRKTRKTAKAKMEEVADVDNDGKITSADALEVLRYSVGLSVSERIGKLIE